MSLRFLEDSDLVEQERDDIHRILFAERKTACEFPFPVDVDATVGRSEDGAACSTYAHLSSSESLRVERELSVDDLQSSNAPSPQPLHARRQLPSSNKEHTNRMNETESSKRIDFQGNNNNNVSAAMMANYAAMNITTSPTFSPPFFHGQNIFSPAWQWVPFVHPTVGSYYVPHIVSRPPAQTPMVGVPPSVGMVRFPYASTVSTTNYGSVYGTAIYQPVRPFVANPTLNHPAAGLSLDTLTGHSTLQPIMVQGNIDTMQRSNLDLQTVPDDYQPQADPDHLETAADEFVASSGDAEITGEHDRCGSGNPIVQPSSPPADVETDQNTAAITSKHETDVSLVNKESPSSPATALIPDESAIREPHPANDACSHSQTQSPPLMEDAVSPHTPASPTPAGPGMEVTLADIYYDAEDKQPRSPADTETADCDSVSDKASTEMRTDHAGTQKRTWASLFKNTATASAAIVKKVEPKGYGTGGMVKQQSNVSISNASSGGFEDRSSVMMDPAAIRLAEVFRDGEFVDRGPSFVLRGIVNRGNWCYVNASLQALMACPPFYHFLRSLSSYLQRGALNSMPLLEAFVKFAMEFPLFDRGRLTGHPLQPLEPTYLYSIISRLRSDSTFKGRQEDAEEFLLQVFNVLHEEMVSCLSLLEKDRTDPSTSTQRSMNGDIEEDTDGSEWQQIGPGRKAAITRQLKQAQSPLSQLFLGQLRYGLTQSGAKESANLEPFYTLPLDVQQEDLAAALKSFTRREQLKKPVGTSKAEIDAVRRVTFFDLPRVLIFHLKYFVYTEEGVKKVIKRMDYSMDLQIDKDLLSNRKSSPPSSRQYKLFAVVFHHGRAAEGGHYTVDIFHAGQWVHVDDTDITRVDTNHVLNFQSPRVPYLLFYRRWESADPTQR